MGSGGSSYFPRASSDLEKLIRDSKMDADRKRLDSDINRLLRKILASYERDPQKVQDCLEKIGDVLRDEADMESFLFGGSVAKHTYVDGLSDIDALVILRREDLAGKSPQAVLNSFYQSLQDRLTSDLVLSVEKGKMAVTVTFRDGTQIQLLPALRVGTKVAIPTSTTRAWNEINPKAFQRMLTQANQRLNNSLVPTIKLIKSIIASFPEQKRLTGYHVESLAVEAVKGYRGEKTVKALLVHILEDTCRRVLSPVRDVTGQSRVVDSYLGGANSTERRIVADALASVVRKLNAATSVDQWKAYLEG
jgi:hypothetical protein